MKNDLIRRSDLLAKKCVIRGQLDQGSPCPTKISAIPVDVIERAPAVDAVEVVRCKECRYLIKAFNSAIEKGGGICGKVYDTGKIEGYLCRVKAYDFCSYGERKEGTEK